MARNEKDLIFEIKQHIGVVANYPTGWTKEVNLIAWNGGAIKFDIRDWDSEHEHMSRGITLHSDEAKKLTEILLGYNNKKIIEKAKENNNVNLETGEILETKKVKKPKTSEVSEPASIDEGTVLLDLN